MLGWVTVCGQVPNSAAGRYLVIKGESPGVTDSTQRLTDLADEELMVRYARDEEAAFEILFARFRQPLFGFLYRFLGRSDRAEDVFQEVFYEVVRARKRFRPQFKFSPWLFRIARNRAVDRLRRNGFRDMASLDAPIDSRNPEGETRLSRLAGDGPDPEKIVQALELEASLESALAELPPEQSEVFWLKEKSGLTFAEIAKLTGVSENTVKSRLRYALEKIRANLTQQGLRP